MTLHWHDLSWPQIHLHNRIDKEARYGRRRISDTPGLDAGEIPGKEIDALRQMLQLGLVEVEAGSHGTGWVRLTDAGCRIRDEGRLD